MWNGGECSSTDLYFLLWTVFCRGLSLFYCMAMKSIVILLYGNEKMGTRGNRFFSIFMYGLLACFVLVGAYIFWKNGMHWISVLEFFDREWITMIPLIGWELAVMRLLILGPTTINVVCSIFYVLSFISGISGMENALYGTVL